MRAKHVLQAGVLVVCAIVAAGCGAPIIAETTVGAVEQPMETTSPEPQERVEGEASLVQDNSESTVMSTTMMTLPTLEYSPAWIEYQELELYYEDDSLENTLEDTRAIFNYMSSNPNDISTPMGALCWAVHELTRSSMIVFIRVLLDDYHIPYLMEEYGVTSEQIGSPGPEATEAFLELVSGGSGTIGITDAKTDGQTILPGTNEDKEPVGSTGEAHNNSEEDSWEAIRLWNDFAGDGTAWSIAIQTVASPEIAAAFRAGEGLPPDVQVYADALGSFAKERADREFDPSAESDDYYFGELSFPGLASFMQAAKYHQDCKRAAIGDIAGMVDASSTSTTTAIPPVVSTTTTTQPTVEETSPSNTSITAPPSVTTTQPLVDDAVPSSSSTTVPASATTQPQVEDTSPSTTTVPVPPVDDSVTTTTSQPSAEEPVATTLPQAEDTSPSVVTTAPVLPVDDSVTTTASLPLGEGPPPDDGGEAGLFDEDDNGE